MHIDENSQKNIHEILVECKQKGRNWKTCTSWGKLKGDDAGGR